MAAHKVIIDTDPATGYRYHDVDDGLAILYMLALSNEFETLGLTVVRGNASLPKAFRKAREIAAVAGRTDMPVLEGASGRQMLGRETAASRFLRDAVRENPGEVTVLAIGPLTNIATTGILDPSFYNDLRRLVFMGGTLVNGRGLPLTASFEFNFWMDRRAAGAVLGAPCEKVLFTSELCRQAIFTRRDLEALRSMPGEVAAYLAGHIAPWLRFNRYVFMPRAGGFVPWDLVAALYLRRPELFDDIDEKPLRLRSMSRGGGGLEPDPDPGVEPIRLPGRILDPDSLVAEFLQAIETSGKSQGSPPVS